MRTSVYSTDLGSGGFSGMFGGHPTRRLGITTGSGAEPRQTTDMEHSDLDIWHHTSIQMILKNEEQLELLYNDVNS